MKQEREVPLLQLNSGDKLKTLQQLRERFNPFQDSTESKKFRALGLKNLYLQMTNPSVELIENAIASLAAMPLSDMQQLRSDTYQAGEDSRKFFLESGIIADDSEKLRDGISNVGKLIDEIALRCDYKSEMVDLGEKSPKVLAGSILERIEVDREEGQLRKTIGQIRSEANLGKRSHMGSKLKQQILDYIGKFSFKFKRLSLVLSEEDKLFEPTWENLGLYSGYSVGLALKDGSSLMGGFEIEDAVRISNIAAKRYGFEKKLEGLPIRNKEEFNALRLEYGAKAANLIILSSLVNNINQIRKDHSRIKLAVPDFKAVPVKLYQAWKDGKLTDDDLRPYFEWADGLKEDDHEHWNKKNSASYIVRSSAIFSEDGESLTGAGIYESIRVDANSAFQDFKKAVVGVFESTNSPRAHAYRAQHGVEKEEMGLIIQKYVEPDYRFNIHGQSQEGYLNSKAAGIPQLMEIVTKTSRNFVKRKELDFFLTLQSKTYLNGDRFSAEIHHFPPDQRKIDPDLPVNVAQLALIVERVWGKDVQIEFVSDGLSVNIVQVRDLPRDLSLQALEMQFLDKPAIHSGASIGIGDCELPVLSDENDNSEKTGVVVFYTNEMFTMVSSSYSLPKEGAVIIGNYGGQNGHIQTLCAEKGLVCLFPDPSREVKTPILQWHELSKLKKVRIVSNGIEGRVYEAQDKSMSEAGK